MIGRIGTDGRFLDACRVWDGQGAVDGELSD